MSFAHVIERRQSLAGEIKQAQADVAEADIGVQRAQEALGLAERVQNAAKERLAERMAEKADLAKEAAAEILGLGEETPQPASIFGEPTQVAAE